MAKSLVIHIGDPKTGSSSIQTVLHDRSYTSPGTSVAYPEQLSAYPLADALADDAGEKQADNRFKATAAWLQASDIDLAIISAEQFSRVDPVKLNTAIATYFPDHAQSARVIAYVRPHAGRFLSAFMQRTKTGVFRDDLKSFFRRTKRQNVLFYAPRFGAWSQVFGSRFTLRAMVPGELREDDVVKDFLHQALQGAPFELPPLKRTNESLSVETLSAVREMQIVLTEAKVPTTTRHAFGSYMGGALNAAGAKKGTRLRLPPDLCRKIIATYRADAEALDAAFFAGQPITRSLDAAMAETTEAAQVFEASAHYNAETVAALRGHAAELAKLFLANPKTWRAAYAVEKGQKSDGALRRAKDTLKRPHLKAVQTRLDAVTTLINGG